ncbi:MAG: B12-binding domain-containing radical SAM protein [Desulfamplus sp.]|nr:B12-binding domain-containing radical SAM protein [Desulfamplus sp.]
MTDILLIQPPVEDFYFTYKRSIPYGLASIAASVQQHGFSVEIMDCLAVKKSKAIQMPKEMEYLLPYYQEHDISIFSLFNKFRHYGYSYEYVGKIVKEKKPFIVGISSLFTPYSNVAETTAEVVKNFLPDCKIVMGGHHPTVLPYDVMRCSAVDFILRGEGEISMPLLAHAIKNGRSIEGIPGIVFRKEHKLLPFNYCRIEIPEQQQDIFPIRQDEAELLHISEPAWIKDFSILPPPAMELVNHNFYSRSKEFDPTQNTKFGSTVVVAGRGCPMPCTYCSVGASSSHGRFRQRDVKDVIHELSLQIEKYNIGFIDFEDENLTLNRKWFLELMEGVTALFKKNNMYDENDENFYKDNECYSKSCLKTVELRAMNGLYPPSLDEEMILAMKAAGFKTLNLSLGSTSLEQLRRFKRPDVRQSFEQVLSIAERHGLETVSYLIAGAPDQSAEDSLNDLIFLAQKKTLIGLSIFYPAPGSVDYEKCRKNGLLPDKFSLMRSSALPITHTTTRHQSLTLLRLARVLNFMKSLLLERQAIPEPEPYKKSNNIAKISDDDRRTTGVSLLKWFLHDGILRGIREDGTVFKHNIDEKLCIRFVKNMREISIR